MGGYDLTIFGSGKSGFLIATDAIYGSSFIRLANRTSQVTKVPFEGMLSVEKSGKEDAFLTVKYVDGSQLTIYLGNVYDKVVIGILQEIIRLQNSQTPAESMDQIDKNQIEEKVEKKPEKAEKKPEQPEEAEQKEEKRSEKAERKTDVRGALFQKGQEAYWKKDYETAFSYYCQAAAEGDIAGIYAMATAYRWGHGVETDVEKAVELYKKSAEYGYSPAQFELAEIFASDEIEKRDMQRALFWYEKSAEQGYARAQEQLAFCYEEGDGVEQSDEKAVYWLEKAANQGLDFSQYLLGTHYKDGTGVDQNAQKALYWFEKSAEWGNSYAQFELSAIYDEKGDIKTSVEWLRKAAEQDHEIAQHNLGVAYVKGEGVERDFEKALEWFLKAKENGCEFSDGAIKKLREILQEKEEVIDDAEKLFSIGMDHIRKKEYETAVGYLKRAADKGWAEAQYMLALCYKDGYGVEKDPRETVKWAEKAANQGHVEAQYLIGVCYLEGNGVSEDMQKGDYWLEKAAAKGYKKAKRVRAIECYNKGIAKIKRTETVVYLETIHEDTKKIVEDYTESMPYLEQAGEWGLLEAQKMLAEILFNESQFYPLRVGSVSIRREINLEGLDKKKGCTRKERGRYWIQKAAEQDDAESIFMYAKCLFFGEKYPGGIIDVAFRIGQTKEYYCKDQVFKMMVRASDLGCTEAYEWLGMAEKGKIPGAEEALKRTRAYRESEEKQN